MKSPASGFVFMGSQPDVEIVADPEWKMENLEPARLRRGIVRDHYCNPCHIPAVRNIDNGFVEFFGYCPRGQGTGRAGNCFDN